MKSAFELAMERLGGTARELTPEQKEQLAEEDRKAEAKIAQIKIATNAKLQTVPPDEREQLRRDMATEIAGVNEHRERRKEALRAAFESA
jgi:hypothetical protein